MCGVAAAYGDLGPDIVEAVCRINRCQRHRGPDAADAWERPGVVLGHTRLAIVDLSDAGRQPFLSAEGEVAVVYNGEIYNHSSLRHRHGLRPASGCDGAVLPEMWRRFGVKMLTELRGMYAVVIHDARDGSLVLARDPFGIKPLYWARDRKGVIWVASEPRVLARLTGQTTLSEEALRHYLAFGSLARDMSPFAGVHAVPANGWVRFSGAGTDPAVGSSPDPIVPVQGFGPTELRAAFVESVREHMVSDVPVALLLSSGVDSAALAWGARAVDARLTCVTVAMEVRGRGEDDQAASIARRFGHEHVVVEQPPDADLVDSLFAAMQRPTIDGFNSFLISRAIRHLGIKVALSGLGGDEMLGGYPHFRHLRALPWLRASDRVGLGRVLAFPPVRRRVARLLSEKAAVLVARGGPRTAGEYGLLRRRVLLDPEVARAAPGLPPAGPPERTGAATAFELSHTEIRGYLGGTLLPDADAFSMCWSVELRVPFVDRIFGSAALSFDPLRGVGKRRFAAALDDPVLVAAANRPKLGFTLPMEEWLRRGLLREQVADVAARSARIREVLSPQVVDEVVGAWEAGRIPWSRMWLFAALEGWLRSLEGAGR